MTREVTRALPNTMIGHGETNEVTRAQPNAVTVHGEIYAKHVI